MTTKPTPASQKRRAATGAPGVNGLITAVALAATLGGWTVMASTPVPAQLNKPDKPTRAEPVVPVVQAQTVQVAVPQLRRVTAPPVVTTRSSR